eukprot:895310-Pelagomonas_calceolata.AAC.3
MCLFNRDEALCNGQRKTEAPCTPSAEFAGSKMGKIQGGNGGMGEYRVQLVKLSGQRALYTQAQVAMEVWRKTEYSWSPAIMSCAAPHFNASSSCCDLTSGAGGEACIEEGAAQAIAADKAPVLPLEAAAAISGINKSSTRHFCALFEQRKVVHQQVKHLTFHEWHNFATKQQQSRQPLCTPHRGIARKCGQSNGKVSARLQAACNVFYSLVGCHLVRHQA